MGNSLPRQTRTPICSPTTGSESMLHLSTCGTSPRENRCVREGGRPYSPAGGPSLPGGDILCYTQSDFSTCDTLRNPGESYQFCTTPPSAPAFPVTVPVPVPLHLWNTFPLAALRRTLSPSTADCLLSIACMFGNTLQVALFRPNTKHRTPNAHPPYLGTILLII